MCGIFGHTPPTCSYACKHAKKLITIKKIHVTFLLDENTCIRTNLCRVLPLLEKVLFGFSKELLDCGRQNHKKSFSGVCVCV